MKSCSSIHIFESIYECSAEMSAFITKIVQKSRKHAQLGGFYALHGIQERRESQNIVFHTVLKNMDDYNTETQFFEVVLVLKTPVDGHQNVTLALSLDDQLGVGKCAPLGLRDGQNVMIGKGLAKTRVDTLV
jgi:hypothetical protein